MELNLQKLLRGADCPLEGSEQFDFSGRDFSHFTVTRPVRLTYRAEHEAGGVMLTFCIGTEVSASCARCLADIRRDWAVDKAYRITEADMREEFPELPFTPGGGIDLDALAYEELVLEVDSVLLCSPDCAGLCPNCGNPRAQCECGPTQEKPCDAGDPRLQVLRQLLTDD